MIAVSQDNQTRCNLNCNLHPISVIQQVIQEHNVEQEIIQAEDDFKIIEHADIAMDDNLGTFTNSMLKRDLCWLAQW